uniref:Uncharacterized protein n=1 Tax=Oryza glumipatula TaxID=40148 RepID=A0A0D9Z1Y4_9ORYZ
MSRTQKRVTHSLSLKKLLEQPKLGEHEVEYGAREKEEQSPTQLEGMVTMAAKILVGSNSSPKKMKIVPASYMGKEVFKLDDKQQHHCILNIKVQITDDKNNYQNSASDQREIL